MVERYSGLARVAAAGGEPVDTPDDTTSSTGAARRSTRARRRSWGTGGALRASMACGNPVAVADLHPGDRVLDLGSGGGLEELPRDLRPAELGRQQAQHLELALAESFLGGGSSGCGCRRSLGGGQQVLGVRAYVVRRGAGDLPEQLRHRRSLVEEEPAVAGRHPVGEGGGEVGRRRVRVAVRVVGERPHQARLDQAAVAARRLRDVQHAVEQVERLCARHPRRRAAGRG